MAITQDKKYAILTSGGDAPGMNAAIRAAVRTALANGLEIYGVKYGFNGLIKNEMEKMDRGSVSDIIHRGGTVLYTARSKRFHSQEGVQEAVEVCRGQGISGVIVVGGDGSFRGARDLSACGVPCIGVPCTIDNDIACSEYTIGYDTALNTCIQMIDKLRDTSQSHDRCSVVEVMGRHSGQLALNVGLATGATSIVVPEVPFSFERDILQRIKETSAKGKRHFLIIVAEGVGGVMDLAKRIEEITEIETRPAILGHVQRGGPPSARDRALASRLGNAAVELLLKGESNRVVAVQGSQLEHYPIEQALNMIKTFDLNLYKMTHMISN
ncbi:MAG: 6-phosphofructokinase [Oscillospiraceae bacterium]|nr:6-phosphofructokinase [Oscillospiraceae bacterium]